MITIESNTNLIRFIDVVVDSRKLITSVTRGIEILRKRIRRYRSKIAIILPDSSAK